MLLYETNIIKEDENMTKQEIFNNDITWLAQKKRIDEELNKIEDMIKLYRDPNTNSINREVAASNISVYGENVRKEVRRLDAIEGELLKQFSYLNPYITIEDYGEDPM